MSGKVVVGVYRQGLSKIFRAAIYRAHRAVVFAIAQLSCFYYIHLYSSNRQHNNRNTKKAYA